MNQIIVEPFKQSTPAGRKVIVFVMVLQALMACNYQMIPMLFYRPKFYCSSETGPIICDQLDACLQQPLNFQSDYTFSSISQEFGFYCDSKKDQATILTFMMMGHIVGGFISTWLSDLGNHKRSVMLIFIVNSLVSGLSCAIGGLTHSTYVLGLALTIWGVSSEIIQNFINMSPTLYFPTEMAKKVFVLVIISWSLYPIMIPAFLHIHLSWRALLVLNLAIPHLLWSAYAWHYSEELAQQTTYPEPTVSEPLVSTTQVQQKKDDNLISVTFRDLTASSHIRNIAVYFLVFSASYVSIFSALFTLGTIHGSIFVNLTTIFAMEIVVSFAGGYVAKRFSVHSTLKVIYIVLFTSFGIYTFLPAFWQSYVVIQGKVLTDVSWILLSSLGIMIVPARFIPLVMSSRAIINLTLVMIMPYIKYFMELVRLNIFIFSAVYEFIAYLSLHLIKTQDMSVL